MKHGFIATGLAAVVALVGVASPASASNQHVGSDLLLEDVELRPGVQSDIHVRFFSKPHVKCNKNTIVAIHGAAASATSWKPLAEALFDRFPHGQRACRIAAIELPGHGESPPPDGILYGDLTLEDYATAVRGTLHRLEQLDLRPRTLMGLSQGGVVLQLVQQQLLDQGSSLREEHGIKRAMLLASVGPQALPWSFSDSGVGPALISQLAFAHPTLGTIVDLPPALWVQTVFTNMNGVIAANAPTPAEVVSEGYISFESIAALGGLVGLSPFSRPDVDAEIFAHEHGTKLDVVAFEHDSLVRPDEKEALYEYLTGEEACDDHFAVVPGEDAVHGMVMSNPDGLIDVLDDQHMLP